VVEDLRCQQISRLSLQPFTIFAKPFMPRKPRGWKEEDEGFSSWVKTAGSSEGNEQYKLQKPQTDINSSSHLQNSHHTVQPIEIQSPHDGLSKENGNGLLPIAYEPVFMDRQPRTRIVCLS